jgi:hypothetical protein
MKLSVKSAVVAGLVSLAFAAQASAQGCVLCYTSLAASGPGAMHAFQMAMFALLIPALLLFVAVFLFILRRARAIDSPRTVSSRKKVMPAERFFSSSAKAAEGRA